MIQACGFNLNISSGIENLHMIMKSATDETYDFDNLLKVINKLTIQNIFFDDERLNMSNQSLKLGQ